MYGTTEIGVVLVNYPGAEDFRSSRARSASRCPGSRSQVQTPERPPVPPGVIGELMLWRAALVPHQGPRRRSTRTATSTTAGRADDVIISAGWTMSAVEIEDALLKHPDVLEVAVIGVPDDLRGQVVKAFVVTGRRRRRLCRARSRTFTRERLSQHEFPRHRRIRHRAAQDAGRQGQPQGAARPRSRAGRNRASNEEGMQ
jgi:acetyl-CoA synthetase